MNRFKQYNKCTNKYLKHLRKIAKHSEFVQNGNAKPVPYATGRIHRMRSHHRAHHHWKSFRRTLGHRLYWRVMLNPRSCDIRPNRWNKFE